MQKSGTSDGIKVADDHRPPVALWHHIQKIMESISISPGVTPTAALHIAEEPYAPAHEAPMERDGGWN